MAQLKELEQGALTYTLIDDNVSNGKKRIVRINYRRCAAWQQVATLLKAFKEYDSTKFDTVIIQGSLDNETSTYQYTNGQLVFDRNVRLGSQMLNRYQIETGNGFSNESLRIVLTD
jgi:coenzyme F420-reducing hydrogenase delta subunit